MNFINPLWLFAAAAISIPIAIHLWNIRPGKTLKVGSVSLFTTSSQQQWRSFKLLEILLLSLRCLLLGLLAFFLAIPYTSKTAISAKAKGWLLIPKKDLKEAYAKFKPLADSLLKNGYELHDFSNGFTKNDIKRLVADTAKVWNNPRASYWDLLSQLNGTMSSSTPIYLITPGTMENFRGRRPEVDLNLHWKIYAPADSSASWVQSAWFDADRNLHVVQGVSNASGNYYENQAINAATQKNSRIQISLNNGQPFVSLKNSKQNPFAIDTAALTVELFADDEKTDAAYINAALSSIRQFSNINLIVEPYDNGNNSSKKDWLFWMSQKPVDQKTLKRFRKILTYGPGKEMAVNSSINATGLYSINQGQQQIPLYKLMTANGESGDVIWHDGFGEPVLTTELKGETKLYHLYGRFNPAWNEMVWSDKFPQLILRLVTEDYWTVDVADHDRRLIDAKQVEPNAVHPTDNFTGSRVIPKDLSRYFWFFLMMIFIAERWLTHKNQSSNSVNVR